jgi:hypothetical protein
MPSVLVYIPCVLFGAVGVLSHCFQGFNLLVPLVAQKEKFHVQPSALGVSSMSLLHPCLFVYCQFVISCWNSLFFFCLFPSFIILGVLMCVFVVDQA